MSSGPCRRGRSGRACGYRLAPNLANPKALVFFGALLPPFLAPGHALLPQVLVLGVTSLVLELLVLVVYGAAAARGAQMLPRARVRRLQTRLAGVGLIAAALGVSAVRVP